MGTSIGSAALVLTASASQLYAGLDKAQQKVRGWAASVASKPITFGAKVGKLVMPIINGAAKAITFPVRVLAGGAMKAVGAIGAALSALGPIAIAGAVAIGGIGIATYGVVQFANAATESYKSLIGSMRFANGEVLKPEQLQATRLALKSWENAQQAIGTAWQRIQVALAPVITMMGELVQQWLVKLQPYIDMATEAFSELASTALVFLDDCVSGIVEVVGGIVQWVQQLFGVEGQFASSGSIIRSILKGVAKAVAYVWDTIKAGAGAVAWVVSWVVEGFGKIVDAFKSVIKDLLELAGELPDSLGGDWFRRQAQNVDQWGNNIQRAGRDMRNWGRDQINAWGDGARAVDAWFDNLDNRRQALNRAAADRPDPFKPVDYNAVGAMTQNSKEAYSIEARFQTEGMLRKSVEEQQLREAQRANQLLQQVVQGITGIRFPAFGMI